MENDHGRTIASSSVGAPDPLELSPILALRSHTVMETSALGTSRMSSELQERGQGQKSADCSSPADEAEGVDWSKKLPWVFSASRNPCCLSLIFCSWLRPSVSRPVTQNWGDWEYGPTSRSDLQEHNLERAGSVISDTSRTERTISKYEPLHRVYNVPPDCDKQGN